MKDVQAKRGAVLQLGRCGENRALCVWFDVCEWQRLYGEGTVHLLHQRNGDTSPYPCQISVDGGMVSWVVTNADVAVAGKGRAELQYHVDDVLVKSDIYTTNTTRSMGMAGPVPPEPEESWVAKVLEAADRAESSVGKNSYIGGNGNWYSWDSEQGAFVDTGVAAQGPVGPRGEQGPTGATGPQGATGETGPQGPVGETGPQGEKGEKGDKGDKGARGAAGADGASTFYTASSGTESEYHDIVFSQDEVETAGREIQQGDLIISADGTVWSVEAFIYETIWAGGGSYVDCSRLASLVGPAGAVPEGWEDRLGTLETQMSNLLYNPITISTFGHNAGTREMGDTVTALTLSWSTNKAPTALALNGEAIDPELTSMALSDLDITGNRTWTLQATDERGAKTVKNTTVSFYNGIYYGGAAQPEIIDSAFIMGLSKKELSGTKNRTISITGGDGLYVWYAYPKRLGTSLFNIGGFDYEYELAAVSFTNKFGYTEDYYVYRSGQYAPASLSVTVKNGG